MKEASRMWDTHLDLGALGERHVEIHYDFTPEEPATMYRSNGDPGDPGCPAEVNVMKLVWDDAFLNNIQFEDLHDLAQEDIWQNIVEVEAERDEDARAEAYISRHEDSFGDDWR